MKELERRFLVKKELFPNNLPYTNIRQGYLAKKDHRVLRIRVENDKFRKASLCYKIYNSAEDRDEFEYKIPYKIGLELLNLCPKILRKRRFLGELFNGRFIQIDEYSNGLLIAEIEYEGEFPNNLPEYIGEEVTGKEEYSNFYLLETLS